MPTATTQPARVFISHSHGDNAACAPLLAALTALGVDYWFDTERLDAGTNLSGRIQSAITERDYFIRVCSSNVQRNPYWVDLETGAFRASQAQASKAGRPNQRVLIPFILDSGYAIQPFEQAVLYIDAAHESVAIWTAQLRRALGLGDAANAPHTTGAGQHRAPTSGATRVVDWRHGAGDHTTIAAAIAAAQPGERILIRRGVYTESLSIDKPLELVGDGDRDDVTIEVSDASVIYWRASNGLIANLTIRQLGGNHYCIDITQGAPDLEDCDISSQGNNCVAIRGAGARPRVRRNRIHDGTASGLYVCQGGQGLIEDNDIFAHVAVGVAVQGGRPTVRRNRINKNTYQAIWVFENGGGVFEQNDLRDNKQGAWNIADDSKANVTRRDNQE